MLFRDFAERISFFQLALILWGMINAFVSNNLWLPKWDQIIIFYNFETDEEYHRTRNAS